MNTTIPSKLHEMAYADTNFTVFDEPSIVFRVGMPPNKFMYWLQRQGALSAAVITAWNPFSNALAPDENERRQIELIEDVVRMQLKWLAAEGRDNDGVWPAEPSICVLDAPQELLDSWLLKYQQNALVYVSEVEGCQLRWHPDI